MEIETKIGIIGWDNQNDIWPLVLMDKSMRAAVGVDLGQWVKVTLGSRVSCGKVAMQFKPAVGSKTISLNEVMASKLDGSNNDVVKVDVADDSEYSAIATECARAETARFAQFMRDSIAARAARAGNSDPGFE